MRRTALRRCGLMFGAALWTFVATNGSAADSPYSIIREPKQQIRADLTFAIEVPKLEATDWIIFVGKPPELPSQSDVTSHFDAAAVSHVEVGGIGRTVLRARIPVTGGPRQTSFEGKAEYEAVLYSRRLVKKPTPAENAPELDKFERDAALRRTPMFDVAAKPFTDWFDEHDLARRKDENDVDLGRRAFLAVVRSIDYKYKSEMPRNASHVCEKGHTDCGGMCVLFVSAMRANKVPARVLVGCWAKSSKANATLEGTRYYQTHVKAEFFAAGVGWVPVDLSSAVLHDRSPEQLRYFGNDPGDFLTMHVDPELKVDSVFFGTKTLPWLQQFYFFVQGKGSLEDITRDMDWQVRSTSLESVKQREPEVTMPRRSPPKSLR
ncbi:MAG: transglutaminase-like domain-containing protein [Pirellulales bacterium]